MKHDRQRINTDEKARCRYLAKNMDHSYELIQSMSKYKIKECGERVVSIPEAALEAGVKILFSETKIAGNLDRIFVIRESLMPDLLAVARDMKERGWILKIEDGYRTCELQTELGRKPEIFDMIVHSCWRETGGVKPSLEHVKKRSHPLSVTIIRSSPPNHNTGLLELSATLAAVMAPGVLIREYNFVVYLLNSVVE